MGLSLLREELMKENFFKDISDQPSLLKPILLVCDSLRLVNYMLECFKKKQLVQGVLEVSKLSGRLVTANSFLGEFQTSSLFSKRKFIVINECDQINKGENQKFVDLLSKLMSSSSSSNHTVILHARSLRADSRLLKVFKEQKQLIKIDSQDIVSQREWLSIEQQRLGLKIVNSKVKDLLLEAALGSCDQLSNILEQVSLIVDEDQPLTVDTLKEFATINSKADPFHVLEIALFSSDEEIELFIDLIIKQKNNLFGLVGLLFRSLSQLQNCANAKRFKQSFTPSLPIWIVKKYEGYLHRLNNGSKEDREFDFRQAIEMVLKTSLKLRSSNLSQRDVALELIYCIRSYL
jgi:hypothetical protein